MERKKVERKRKIFSPSEVAHQIMLTRERVGRCWQKKKRIFERNMQFFGGRVNSLSSTPSFGGSYRKSEKTLAKLLTKLKEIKAFQTKKSL